MEKKIKIDVITLHAVQNYGSVLQALATQEILKQHLLTGRYLALFREHELLKLCVGH